MTSPVEHRLYALIYAGITHASDSAGPMEDFIRLSERERIAAHVFNELAAAGAEIRLPDDDHQARHAADAEVA